MSNTDLALVIEPQQLQQLPADPKRILLDLSSHQQYSQAHIPGAVFLDYGHIVGMQRPYTGLLPDEAQFEHIINSLGFSPDSHIIAYDEEGGGKAARLIWTLHAMGHHRASLLNGGLIAWYREQFPLSNEAVHTQPNARQQHYVVKFSNDSVIASTEYILSQLDNPQLGLLDARSLEEYTGNARYAQQAGHIPGAQHLEWTQFMDAQTNYRLLPKEKIQQQLDALGLSPDKEIIVYCQSHHRSALPYLVLKYLGYERVRGYPGSWSEWGNRQDTPIER